MSSWWRCCLGHSKNFSDDDDDDECHDFDEKNVNISTMSLALLLGSLLPKTGAHNIQKNIYNISEKKKSTIITYMPNYSR